MDNAVAADLTPEPSVADYFEMPVRITCDGSIYIGEHKMPGVIADGGVTIKPGGPKDINTLTVVFLVGEVHVDDGME